MLVASWVKIYARTTGFVMLAGITCFCAKQDLQTKNHPESKLVTLEYRITSQTGSLPVQVEFTLGKKVLVSENATLPMIGAVKKMVKQGESMALYLSTYNSMPTTLTYEIWVDGKKMVSQTEESQNFMSNNISCSL